MTFGNSQYDKSEKRREDFLDAFSRLGNPEDAAAEVGVSIAAVTKWRQRFREFAIEYIRLSAQSGTPILDPKGPKLAFAPFRKQFFSNDTPAYQADVIAQIENAPAGSLILILMPPEHGKTTIIEDFIGWKLAYDKDYRVLVGCSVPGLAAKRVQRVQNRMSPDGPFPEYVRTFGPFEPDKNKKEGYQPWTKSYFNVQGKGANDSREYNLEARGIFGAIAGARCDLLVLDDIQEYKTLSQTEKLLTTVRQDWLSRPGAKGVTIVIGTRVGPDDVYQRLQDEGLCTKVVSYPAVIEGEELWPGPVRKEDPSPGRGVKFLWPERYSPDEYKIMRVNAGETAWERNYMQRGVASSASSFTADMIELHSDRMRGIHIDPADLRRRLGAPPVLTCALDPGYGVNAVMVGAMTPDALLILDGRRDTTLTNTRAIAEVVEQLLVKWHTPQYDMRFRSLVIEDKAFQRGLLRDDSILALRDRFGLSIVPHQTGSEKNDPDIGIPSMAAGLERGQIILPHAEDKPTLEFYELVRKELLSWRPGVRGNRLAQDMVVVMWFLWMQWRKHRETLDALASIRVDGGGFKVRGLPYAPTSPLLVTTPGGRR